MICFIWYVNEELSAHGFTKPSTLIAEDQCPLQNASNGYQRMASNQGLDADQASNGGNMPARYDPLGPSQP